jgi:DNA polymerase III subunit gamma/tau
VFGFTSQQSVANLTDKILHGATADAVQLLHEQCEAGKDMMRLISDLIAYLRDLLVFKVKPEALSEDVDSDLQKSLSAQAELIETDRLLELIDQFAEAEGRMKWAPNKKLHFEVALIKAIQSLKQITLNQVIENLNALRDGKETPAKKAAAVAGVGDAGLAAVSNRDYKEPAARVAEKPDDSSAVTSTGSSADTAKIWREVCAKIPRRGFLRTLVDSLTVLGTDGRNFLLGYPPEEKSAIETLATMSNRRQLEALLKEVSGRDWTAKLNAKEGLTRANDQPPRRADEFKDDRLIQEALEMFKGEIKS